MSPNISQNAIALGPTPKVFGLHLDQQDYHCYVSRQNITPELQLLVNWATSLILIQQLSSLELGHASLASLGLT